MEVVRDVLDKQLIDPDGCELGRVDGILLECGSGPPRLSAVLIGLSVLGHRIHPVLGTWVAAAERLLGLGGRRPLRVDFTHLTPVGHDIAVGLPAATVAAEAVEHGLRVWLMKVPGAQ